VSTAETLAAVQSYIAAFNDGDETAMSAMFAPDGVIVDGMAPHVWLGPSAAKDWYRDVLVEAEHHGASGYAVTLDEPLHHDITGDSAYLVLPATMRFSVKGVQVTQTGAYFTVALRRLTSGWRIAAWAWTKGHQKQ
jgi:ketosteroid isomerase-like protein